jgi:hypothetical protein
MNAKCQPPPAASFQVSASELSAYGGISRIGLSAS